VRVRNVVALVVFGPPAVLLVALGGAQCATTARILLANHTTRARVVEMVENKTAKSRNFTPVFEYEYLGKSYRGRPRGVEQPPGKHRVGDDELVHVDPEAPERILLGAFADRWLPGVVTVMIGLVISLFLWTFVRSKDKR